MAALYPTYDEICQAHELPGHTDATNRIFWRLDGPLETNVFVLSDSKHPTGDREPYFRQTLDDTSWHPISRQPLTRTKVSSVTVRIDQLEYWVQGWLESHRGCMGTFEELGEDKGDGLDSNLKRVQCYDEDIEADSNFRRVRCCDEDRPTETPPLTVYASLQPYVTVHDYLTSVHPWLIGLRQKILEAWDPFYNNPLPAAAKLMVNYNGLDKLTIMEESEWILFVEAGCELGPLLSPEEEDEAFNNI